MTYNITQGLAGVEGARYVLNLGFKSNSGNLSYTGVGCALPHAFFIAVTAHLDYLCREIRFVGRRSYTRKYRQTARCH